jgi:hypothetical protein
MKVCPKCRSREWPDDCEQSISIEWHGECVGCKFTNTDVGSSDGAAPELDAIAAESQKRKFDRPGDTGGI